MGLRRLAEDCGRWRNAAGECGGLGMMEERCGGWVFWWVSFFYRLVFMVKFSNKINTFRWKVVFTIIL